MATTADFRNGFTYIENGDLYQIIEFHHVKPGKGGAFVRTKLRNVKTKQVIERTYRSGEKIEEIRLERRPYEYLYFDGAFYVFMDTETYEQIQLGQDILGDPAKFLIENTEITILFYETTPIEVEMPMHMNLEVVETEPGLRGNTATNVLKPAKLSSGADIVVPLFIEVGDTVRVNTRTGEYIERVKK